MQCSSESPALMQLTLAQPATTAFQQCHVVCFDACSCAPAASLNPTYTYGAQKEGSTSPPPAPSISALQVSTTQWTSAVCQWLCTILQGNAGLTESLFKFLWVAKQAVPVGVRCIWDSERPRNMCGLLLSGTTGNRLPHASNSQLANRTPDSQHASAYRPPHMPGG